MLLPPPSNQKKLHDIMSMEITTVVEEELLPNINVLVGVDADPVVASHNEDLHLAVGLAAVVGKPDLASHPEVDGIGQWLKFFSSSFEMIVRVTKVASNEKFVHKIPKYIVNLAASTQKSSFRLNM